MIVPVVLDASALLAIDFSERGGDVVLAEMRKAPGDVLIHAVNAYEVAFKLMIRGVPEASAWEAATYGGVRLVKDMGDKITVGASRLKVSSMFLSMADTFCLALGEAVDGVVLTSDKAFSSAKQHRKWFCSGNSADCRRDSFTQTPPAWSGGVLPGCPINL